MRVHLRFAGIERTIAFDGDPRVLEDLRSAVPGWPFATCSPNSGDPAIAISASGGRCRVAANPALGLTPATYHGRLAAVNGILADLILTYMSGRDSEVCLHAAGVAFDAGVVALSGATESGKSTLSVRLAALGGRVFTDDALPVSIVDGMATALGIPPRLRRPLPREADPLLRTFLKGRLILRSRGFAYVRLPPEGLAPFGERAPLAAVVLLHRDPTLPPALQPVPRAAALQHLIRQSFVTPAPAESVLRHWRRVVDRVPCFMLTYGDGANAAERLIGAFAGRAAA